MPWRSKIFSCLREAGKRVARGNRTPERLRQRNNLIAVKQIANSPTKEVLQVGLIVLLDSRWVLACFEGTYNRLVAD